MDRAKAVVAVIREEAFESRVFIEN